MKCFKLRIVNPDGERYCGEAQSIRLRTTSGDVQILAGHADYLATLGTGCAKLILADGTERIASASGGFVSVSNSEVSVVATTFEYASEIDVKRAEAAKERAEQTIAAAKEELEISLAKAKLARALSRLCAAKSI